MINKYEKDIIVSASLCDHKSLLNYASPFSLFMDIAGEHAPKINLGMLELLEKGLFWLTCKTKVKFISRPKMFDNVCIHTWPQAPQKIRCNRFYQILKGDDILIEGKTEWAVIEINSGKLTKISDIYPTDLAHFEKEILPEPFEKMNEDFSSYTKVSEYNVRSVDIDLGNHMNNAVYSKIIIGSFSCEQLNEINISQIEIAFKSPSYEKDVISIHRKQEEGCYNFILTRENNQVVATAKIEFSK